MTEATGSARRRTAIAIAVCVLVVCVAAGGVAGWNLSRPVPSPTLRITFPQALLIATPAALPVPLPQTGAFAFEDSAAGEVVQRAGDTPVPTASIAKTETALALLSAQPLDPGAAGPVYTVTSADVALTRSVIAEGGSYVPVEAGERLSERDLLTGMMLPSANNFALMVANEVDGSEAAFVSRLNRMAAAQGMTHTHFADPDGLDPATVSTPNDLLILGKAAVANPTLVSVMALSQATMPDGAQVSNIDHLVGTIPGWLGIKTGHTYAAGYCLLFAVRRTLAPGTQPVTVVGVVVGQPTREDTFSAAKQASDADFANYSVADLAGLAPRPGASAALVSQWGASTPVHLAPGPAHPYLTRSGQTLSAQIQVSADAPAVPVAAGTRVGTVTAVLGDGSRESWPIVTDGTIPAPSPEWHALHG